MDAQSQCINRGYLTISPTAWATPTTVTTVTATPPPLFASPSQVEKAVSSSKSSGTAVGATSDAQRLEVGGWKGRAGLVVVAVVAGRLLGGV